MYRRRGTVLKVSQIQNTKHQLHRCNGACTPSYLGLWKDGASAPKHVGDFFQMKPTRCTLLLSIFISTSVHVSGNYVPITRRTYCIYVTLVFFTLYGWLSGLQTRQPPIQSKKYQCHIDTVSSPDDGHIIA